MGTSERKEAMDKKLDTGNFGVPLEQKCFLMFKWNRLL